MKKWKVFLIILTMIVTLMCLTGCDAYYHAEGSDWTFGTDGSIFYHPNESNWLIKIW